MPDGEIVYSVKVDSTGGEAEARKAGEQMGQALNDSGESHSSKWKEVWTGAARQIGAEIVNLGLKAAESLGNAVIDITKSAVEGFAEQEQLIGGAKLMYGDAYDFISQKASEAYKNVQMSQNEYLEQVNGFATGLKTALGGNAQAAAELADKIVTAEADVVAATGNSREAVENAFNGIMKSNYTMLDNLQLGITPTKEGFQEVIDKVNAWRAENGKATNYVIDNLADCQSALVDYIEMQGIAGYASAEASDTIMGSVDSMKSAWSNLVTGLADENANMEELVGNFIDSVSVAAENLLPVIGQAIDGVFQLIDGLIPMIVEYFSENADQIAESGVELIITLAMGLVDALPQLIQALVDILLAMVMSIGDHLPDFIEMAVKIIVALVEGLFRAIPQLLGTITKLIADIIAAFFNTDWKSIGKNILDGIWNGIQAGWNWLVDKVKNIARSLLNAAKAVLGIKSPSKEFAYVGRMTTEGTAEGMEEEAPDLTRTVTTIYSGLIRTAKDAVDEGIPMSAIMPSVPDYTMGDIERHLSATLTATGKSPDVTITVPLYLNDREIARATAWNMGEQLAWEEM